LVRARETAEPIAEVAGVAVAVDPRLIESANVFEGSVVEVGPALLTRPLLWRHLVNPFTPSWGEPYGQVAARMAAAVADAGAASAGREVVLVSHQLPIWTLRRHLEGRHLWHRPDRRQCGLASVTSVGLDASGGVVWLRYVEPVGLAGGVSGRVGA
ncbi:MAG: histidine phosphatase family protein, partial [Mycobacteriales bacterium]